MVSCRLALAVLLAAFAFPASAVSRPADSTPDTEYSLTADAFVRPSATDVRLTVRGPAVPAQLEQVQVKIWPAGTGNVETTNFSDVASPNGVATVRVGAARLLQRVEVQAHVKDGRQNVLRDETVVQYEQLGAVSSDHPLATKAGEDVLRGGGNAFDAAAAMVFVLNVVQPSLAGIGGGSEVVVHVAAEGRDYAIVGRERSPAATTSTTYAGQTQPRVGFNGYSVGVPGTLRTVEAMLERWGTDELADALEPAIQVAADGFPVGAFLASESALLRTGALQPETVARFRRADGTPLQRGDPLVQPELADTFRRIAREGTSVFYGGEIGRAIVEAQKRIGVGVNAIADGAGLMTLDDLAAYEVDIRAPSHLDYRGYDVFSAPPPTNGGQVLLESLGLLEQKFPIGDVSAGYGFGSRHTIHAMVESLRLAMADRNVWIGDPAAVAVPETQLLSDAYLRDRVSLINPFPTRLPGDAPPGNPFGFTAALDDEVDVEAGYGHTTHFSVIDKLGNVVSFTTTLRDSFGSGIMVTPYGFVLNNSLSLFNMNPKLPPDPGANNAGPSKRPMGSQTPTLILKDGEPFAATGTSGAEFIPSLVLNVVLDLIDHGMPLQTAVDASRIWTARPDGNFGWAYAARPGAPTFDQFCAAPFPSRDCTGEIEELIRIGHIAGRRPTAAGALFGSLASVGVNPATSALEAAADPRKPDATAIVVAR